MTDKNEFLEMLKDLTQLAAVKGNVLSQREIREYLEGMHLDEEKLKHVYTYLSENHIKVEGFDNPEKVEKEKKSDKDSVFLKRYMRELSSLEKGTREDERAVLIDMARRVPGARDRLIQLWLPKVAAYAKRYQNRGVLLEDIIQEGNMGLLDGLEKLEGRMDIDCMEKELEDSVIRAIERMMEEASGNRDLENALTGRSNLIQEAVKYLAKDLGRMATAEELADYTKLSVEEIHDFITLTRNEIKIGKGE